MRFPAFALAGLAGGALLLAGCRLQKPATPDRPVRVLLIGLDGATWDFVDPLLDRGALPHIERLVREGARAPLQTLQPALSPAVWTTIATGKRPVDHGITGFETKDESGLVTSRTRATEALWTILSRSGRSAGFVGWWGTWPAEEVSGWMVSEHFLRPHHEKLPDGTWPRALAAELDAAIPADWPWLREVLADGGLKLMADTARGPAPVTEERWRQGLFFYEQDHRGEQAALHLLRHRPRPELVGLLSRKIDIASHYAARFLPEEERDGTGMSRALEAVYRYEDGLVGRLIDAAGPGVSVLVVSDHGFERTGRGWDHRDASPPGIFIASGPAFRGGITSPPVSVLDVTPTVLHVLGLPVGQDMPGRVPEGLLAESRPVPRIASWETGRRAARGPRSPVEDELREQLRALGYVQ